jgi:hypothetical protein
MFFNLENANKSTKYEIFRENQKVYNDLKILNEQNLGQNKNNEIKKLLDKIDATLSPDIT